ncbi:hypothetical protein ACN42_g6320 [Penicillium freii]|uniref:Uncharacterized protein n=1 Tax=Penicillium freii TaxID=48697 RepID=A0A101MHR7_PENFR|nr:hypothetical protein ACN42_g6320 [Penicillium freii]
MVDNVRLITSTLGGSSTYTTMALRYTDMTREPDALPSLGTTSRVHGKMCIPNKKRTKTYNSEDSLVVTHPTTNSPACGLSTAERTGSPVFHTLWSYVSC